MLKLKNISIIIGILVIVIIKGIGYNNIPDLFKIIFLLFAAIFMIWYIKGVKRPEDEKKLILIVGGILILEDLLICSTIFIKKMLPNFYYRISNVTVILNIIVFVMIIVIPSIILIKRRIK